MIQRRVVVPAGVDQLWRALTDPEEASQWLGGRLDWNPEEGGTLTFAPEGAGSGRPEPGWASGSSGSGRREGRIEEVVPGRYLRFVWWPVGGGPEEASEVAYSLEPVIPGPGGNGLAGSGDSDGGDGSPATILTVEEAPAPAPARASAVASAADSWGVRDDLEWRVFAARQFVGAVAR